MDAADYRIRFLNLRRLPGMIGQGEVAILLGVAESCVPILVRDGLLRPLATIGHAGSNTVKHFAAVEIERFARDPEFLSRAHLAVARHWEKKNTSAKRSRGG